MSAPAPAELRGIDLFDELDDAQLAEWAAAAEVTSFGAGEVVAEQEEHVGGLQLIIEGTAQALVANDGRIEAVGDHVAPTWMGAIASLTDDPLSVRIVAVTDVRIALVPKDRFFDLIMAHRSVFRRAMAQVRPVLGRITAMEQNRERLAALGTMAAGLAHELNNPAAAARRSAGELADALEAISSAVGSFVDAGMEREQAAELVAVQQESLAAAARREPGDALADADAEDDLLEALEDLGVEEPWRYAESLVAAGADRAWLGHVAALAGPAVGAAVRWIAASLTARQLAAELAESTDRMSALVGAVKSYAYMDRGGVVEANVHEGLETTLTILGHKLKHTSIEVRRDYDRSLPKLTL
ncbi:MAG TPA: Crp/Fnr family transcriptional regulator, partial [Solirubrobacteraceae bacterium]